MTASLCLDRSPEPTTFLERKCYRRLKTRVNKVKQLWQVEHLQLLPTRLHRVLFLELQLWKVLRLTRDLRAV